MKFFRFLSLIAMTVVMVSTAFFLPPPTLSVPAGLALGLALTLAVMVLAWSLARRHQRQDAAVFRQMGRVMFFSPARLCPD